jgi:hypothetical protein
MLMAGHLLVGADRDGFCGFVLVRNLMRGFQGGSILALSSRRWMR